MIEVGVLLAQVTTLERGYHQLLMLLAATAL